MKIAVIVNGISLEKRNFYQKFLPVLSQSFHTEIFETRTVNDAVLLSSKAVDKRFDIILAAGGDGTLNQVVNGVLRGRENYADLPVVGVLPIGTGNDLARGLNIRADVYRLLALLTDPKPIKIDVGKVYFTTNEGSGDYQYFVNVADIGMGPEVVRKVLAGDRLLGAGMSYYLSIMSTFISYKPMVVRAKTAAWEWEGELRTLAIANSKYYGHGLCIAPDAKTDDGIFEVFICGNASIFDFILQSGRLKRGKKISHKDVLYRRATEIDLGSASRCAIEADGEFLGWLPARIELMSQKLKFLL